MIRGNLPPQAYTKEVLAQAFAWLQSQDDRVKQMAQSSDALVALYLRAKRHGEGAPVKQDAPASVESFRHQLKSLASDLQQFITEEEKARMASSLPQIDDFKEELKSPTPQAPFFQAPQNPARPATPPVQPQQAPSSPGPGVLALDSQSLEILKKVRNHLNLSSEMEALRMLLSLGFERLQTLIRE